MPATGAKRGNLVYHWKHGWIPLDHFAALSKAHHSKSGAVKVMQKHGIDVHDAYKGAGHNGAPKPKAPAHTAGVDPHAVPSSGGRKYSDAEIKRGYDMSGKAIPKAGEHAPAEKRAHVTHSGDGTLLSIDRNDTEARDAAKAAGFRWSSNLGSWYLPRNHTESTRRSKVSQLEAKLGKDHVHVEDSGSGKTTTAAEREAAQRARASQRAEHMDAKAQRKATEADVRFGRAKAIGDMIPFGQPILVGHHSEGRHRRDLASIHSNMDKGFQAHQESKDAAAAAERARQNAKGDDPLMRQRRIDRNEAEIRSIDRKLSDHVMAAKLPQSIQDRTGIKPLPAEYHARLTASRAELADQVAHDKAQIAASGHKAVTAADVKAGDMVQHRNSTYIVTKVNKTTVSVPSIVGGSWEDKVPINQVTRHIPLSTQSDSAVQAAYANAKHAKVKAALAAELKRRGLLTGN